jgi:nitrate reductase / nitrite oxidoreductase, beta subunit
MPEVFNWQLGRKMDFPYPEVRPERQFSMAMDPNKCIACQTCTVACKSSWTGAKGQEYMYWNNVETKPYGFYPTGWDVRSLELIGEQTWDGTRYEGKTVFEAAPQGEVVAGWLPESETWAHPNIGEDEPVGVAQQGTYIPGLPHESMWMFYLQRICNHCTYPACLAACPRKSIYKREDGFVLLDQSRCRGYRECMKACPYKKIFFNNSTRVSEKCVGCFPLLEEGEMNRCVTTCIGRIRLSGFINAPDEADPRNPMDYLVHVRKAVVPLYPQFGTEPNVYYFPPVHVPDAYLTQMFGPDAPRAAQMYRDAMAGKDTELRGLLLLFGATDRLISRFEVRAGKAMGYDKDGALLAEVPLQEPAVVRPLHDAERGTYRTNIT